MTAFRSIFTNNDASVSGGAIWTLNSRITASTFRNNSSGYIGGAVIADTATIARSRFTRNAAGEHGGAVILLRPSRDDLRKLRRNTFSRNTAASGGAMTLGFCLPLSRSQAAQVERANRFSGNRATEQRRTQNIERPVGSCGG